MNYLIEDEEVLILQCVPIVFSITEVEYLGLLYFDGLTILENGIARLEPSNLTQIAHCRDTQYRRSLRDGPCVLVIINVEILNEHVLSRAYGVEVIQIVPSQSLILDGDV